MNTTNTGMDFSDFTKDLVESIVSSVRFSDYRSLEVEEGIEVKVPMLDLSVNYPEVWDQLVLEDEKVLLREFVREGGEVVFSTRLMEETSCFGQMALFEDANGTIRPRISIGILKGSRRHVIMPGTIVHEYHHWKQWHRGDLALTEDGGKLWKGEKYHFTSLNEEHGAPWEKEAREVQCAYLKKRWGWIPLWAIKAVINNLNK